MTQVFRVIFHVKECKEGAEKLNSVAPSHHLPAVWKPKRGAGADFNKIGK